MTPLQSTDANNTDPAMYSARSIPFLDEWCTAPLPILEVVRLNELSDMEATCVSFPILKAKVDEPERLLSLLAKFGGTEVNCCRPSRRVTVGACVAVSVTSVSRSNDMIEIVNED